MQGPASKHGNAGNSEGFPPESCPHGAGWARQAFLQQWPRPRASPEGQGGSLHRASPRLGLRQGRQVAPEAPSAQSRSGHRELRGSPAGSRHKGRLVVCVCVCDYVCDRACATVCA